MAEPSVTVEPPRIYGNCNGRPCGNVDAILALESDLLSAQKRIAELAGEVAEMTAVCGSKCPKCGHWLKAEHDPIDGGDGVVRNFSCWRYDNEHEPICPCEISVAEMRASYPEVAKEMGLTNA